MSITCRSPTIPLSGRESRRSGMERGDGRAVPVDRGDSGLPVSWQRSRRGPGRARQHREVASRRGDRDRASRQTRPPRQCRPHQSDPASDRAPARRSARVPGRLRHAVARAWSSDSRSACGDYSQGCWGSRCRRSSIASWRTRPTTRTFPSRRQIRKCRGRWTFPPGE